MDKQNKSQLYQVEVVSNDGCVVKKLGPMVLWRAEKVDRGMNINLDHTRFYTRVVEVRETVDADGS